MKEKFLEFYRKGDKALDKMHPLLAIFSVVTLMLSAFVVLFLVFMFLYVNFFGPAMFLLIPGSAMFLIYLHWPKG